MPDNTDSRKRARVLAWVFMGLSMVLLVVNLAADGPTAFIPIAMMLLIVAIVFAGKAKAPADPDPNG